MLSSAAAAAAGAAKKGPGPAAQAAPIRCTPGYTLLPPLEAIIEVSAELEMKTGAPASAGVGQYSCDQTLDYAAEQAARTVFRARAILNSFPHLWQRCVGRPAAPCAPCAPRAPRAPTVLIISHHILRPPTRMRTLPARVQLD
jgi:hypothetical protein